MITGALRVQVDRIWDAFWSGGIANPLEVLDQVTHLLFARRLDELGAVDDEELRWSRFTALDPEAMHRVVAERVFPFLRSLGDGSTYADHMRDARLTIPTPALLAKVVAMLDDVPMDDRDTNGDLYEHMLGKIASAGQNGQFRTPRHVIRLMVALTDPRPDDVVCDPAAGTSGFLVAAAEHVRARHSSVATDPDERRHFHQGMFHGYDFDATMLRIGSMNMLLHGIEQPDIRHRDSLAGPAQDQTDDAGRYSLVLANPPFAGIRDAASTAPELRELGTRKSELLFLTLVLRLLRPGGRAAVVVPVGVLSGASPAHRALRRVLVEEQRLEGVVRLPSGVFRPYTSVATAILLFTRTDAGGTDDVWFHDVRADGFSLDDRRSPVADDDLPDVLARWAERRGGERDRARTDQSFCVPRAEIAATDHDLAVNRYARRPPARARHDPPGRIVEELESLEGDVRRTLAELRELL